jgi:5,6-dimethylbenzimidazole synthase
MDAQAKRPAFDGAFREHFASLLAWRRDVRHFRRDPLPEGLVERLLELAALAPSVGLSEPWRFVVVNDPACRARVRDSFAQCNAAALAAQAPERADLYARLKLAGLEEAPCHLAIFVESEPAQGYGLGRMTQPETLAFSAVMAAHTFWLAARTEGVGVGWVSILEPQAIGPILAVPPSWRFIGYLCVGYPDEDAESPELERAGWERRAASRSTILYR